MKLKDQQQHTKKVLGGHEDLIDIKRGHLTAERPKPLAYSMYYNVTLNIYRLKRQWYARKREAQKKTKKSD